MGGCHGNLLSHGDDLVCVCTEFQYLLPETIYYCLQTCLLFMFIQLIKYINTLTC